MGKRQCSRSWNNYLLWTINKRFAALGHGIMDIDTGELLEIANGEIVTTNIISVIKGEKEKSRRNKREYNKTKTQ